MSIEQRTNANEGADSRAKADVSKYTINSWDDSRIKQAAAGLQRHSPTTPGQGIMFAVIPGAPIVMAPTHYVSGGDDDDQRGTYICLRHIGEQPICCEALEEPTMRVNVLAVIYNNTNNAGRLPKGVAPEVTVGYIRLSASNHQTITNMLPDGVEPSQIDIIMSKAKRLGYEFSLPSPGSTPRYVEAGLREEVMQSAAKWMDGQALVKRLGKELSRLGWRMLLKHLGAGVAEEVDLSNLDDVDEFPSAIKGIGETDDDELNGVNG